MARATNLLTTNRKALTVNLDEQKYGTFAEIGAGQEVARMFFRAGGAAGTVAKSMSAYDMTFSDSIYGRAPRYVSRERLVTMLDHEFTLLRERLAASRGDRTTFFVFADTVAAQSFKRREDCHGWMGVRFQAEPGAEPSEIIIHVRMWDRDNVLQQQALGIAGVNLLYGAFYYRDDPVRLIVSLVDNVGSDRIEVDMLTFGGPAFSAIDHRVMSLHLVRFGLTNAVLFGPQGDVLQPSEALRRKALLVERGGFRPVTRLDLNVLQGARARMLEEPAVAGRELMVLTEIVLQQAPAAVETEAADLLARVDLLGLLGLNVLISDYPEYYRLTSYLRRYTAEMIGVAMGMRGLVEIFDERGYETLPGGILEGFGRLFRNAVKLYVHPGRRAGLAVPAPEGRENDLVLEVSPHLRNLYAHLVENRYLHCISGPDPDAPDVPCSEILQHLQEGRRDWETMVPPPVVQVIRQRKLLGYRPPSRGGGQ